MLRETRDREFRVALLPGGVAELVTRGHEVRVACGAGEGSGFPDAAYAEAGALLVEETRELIEASDVLTKVKEPTPDEARALRDGQVLFAFLHLAPQPKLAATLLERGVTSIAFESVETEAGRFPLLEPMSAIAGRLSVQLGAHHLQADQGGRGVLLAGVPGVARGRVCVLGAGVVGTEAARIAVGLGADVVALDVNVAALSRIERELGGRVHTLQSSPENLRRTLHDTDLLIGAVLVPGARAPCVVRRDDVERMPRGAVIVDVAIDQGGCVETIRATSHTEPTYVEAGVVHYAVPNMPGAVPRTATLALSQATLPYLLRICDSGVDAALAASPPLARAVNTYRGEVTLAGVAQALDRPLTPAPWA